MKVLCTVPDNTNAQQILQFLENIVHFETRYSEYNTNVNRKAGERTRYPCNF